MHVPSETEWVVLDSFLAHNGYNYDGSLTGSKYAKAMADTVLWDSDTGTGAVGNTDYPTYRNKSGFSGLPGGYRNYNGVYDDVSFYNYWWSSTQANTGYAWYRILGYSDSDFYGYDDGSHENGFSVRCLRD